MRGIILHIGQFTAKQKQLVRGHRSVGRLRATFGACSGIDALHKAFDGAIELSGHSLDISPFFAPAFKQQTGVELAHVIAVVIPESLEEALAEFNELSGNFFKGRPLFVVRGQETSTWIDEK
ncbi:MAG TPA: hypothetical protein VFZ48_05020 [Candidatus Saccharimonadales bacterium]